MSRYKTLKDREGNPCLTNEEEKQEWEKMLQEVWQAERITEEENVRQCATGVDYMAKHNCQDRSEISFSKFDVQAATKRCKPNKALPYWSRNGYTSHICSDILSAKDKEIWQQVGVEERLPLQWQTTHAVFIDKPGKDSSIAINRRGINKAHFGAKQYTTFLHDKAREKTSRNSPSSEWGAQAGKATTHPMCVLNSILSRAKAQGKNVGVFLGDVWKAFDGADRDLLSEAIITQLRGSGLVARLLQRHRRTVFVVSTLDGKEEMVFNIPKGVIQGDALGPLLYIIYMRAFMANLSNIRNRGLIACMSATLVELNETGRHEPNRYTVDLSSHFFVDDHLEVFVFNGLGELRAALEPIAIAQQLSGIKPNHAKTIIGIVMRGKGARKKLSSLNSKLRLWGIDVQLVTDFKYLGAQFQMSGSTLKEVDSRIDSARKAFNRLSRKVWANRKLPLRLRVMLYNSLVSSILLYGLEVRQLTRAQIARLEKFQTRCIRNLLEKPNAVAHESNQSIRKEAGVFTVESQLMHKRLSFWQKVFRSQNALRPVRAAVFGSFSWDTKPQTYNQSPVVRQIIDDLTFLRDQSNQRGIPWNHNQVSHNMAEWFKQVPKTKLRLVLGHESMHELRERSQREVRESYPHNPEFLCLLCEPPRQMGSKRSLATHRWSAHGIIDDVRAQVRNNVCPGCDLPFVNKEGAQIHWQRQICVHNNTAKRTVEEVQRRLDLQEHGVAVLFQ